MWLRKSNYIAALKIDVLKIIISYVLAVRKALTTGSLKEALDRVDL